MTPSPSGEQTAGGPTAPECLTDTPLQISPDDFRERLEQHDPGAQQRHEDARMAEMEEEKASAARKERNEHLRTMRAAAFEAKGRELDSIIRPMLEEYNRAVALGEGTISFQMTLPEDERYYRKKGKGSGVWTLSWPVFEHEEDEVLDGLARRDNFRKEHEYHEWDWDADQYQHWDAYLSSFEHQVKLRVSFEYETASDETNVTCRHARLPETEGETLEEQVINQLTAAFKGEPLSSFPCTDSSQKPEMELLERQAKSWVEWKDADPARAAISFRDFVKNEFSKIEFIKEASGPRREGESLGHYWGRTLAAKHLTEP